MPIEAPKNDDTIPNKDAIPMRNLNNGFKSTWKRITFWLRAQNIKDNNPAVNIASVKRRELVLLS